MKRPPEPKFFGYSDRGDLTEVCLEAWHLSRTFCRPALLFRTQVQAVDGSWRWEYKYRDSAMSPLPPDSRWRLMCRLLAKHDAYDARSE